MSLYRCCADKRKGCTVNSERPAMVPGRESKPVALHDANSWGRSRVVGIWREALANKKARSRRAPNFPSSFRVEAPRITTWTRSALACARPRVAHHRATGRAFASPSGVNAVNALHVRGSRVDCLGSTGTCPLRDSNKRARTTEGELRALAPVAARSGSSAGWEVMLRSFRNASLWSGEVRIPNRSKGRRI